MQSRQRRCSWAIGDSPPTQPTRMRWKNTDDLLIPATDGPKTIRRSSVLPGAPIQSDARACKMCARVEE